MAILVFDPFILFPAVGGFSPTDVSNIVGWWDATDVKSGSEPSDSDAVSAWQDLSVNGLDLSQVTGTKQPVYKTNIQNSKPGVLFDGGDALSVSTSTYTQPNTICLVWKFTASGANYMTDGGSSNNRHIVYTPDATNLNMYAGGNADTLHDYDTDPHYGIFCFDSSTSEVWVDGVQTASGIDPDPDQLTDFWLGNVNSEGGSGFKGYIFEAILYNRNVADVSADITSLNTYFAAKWGI